VDENCFCHIIIPSKVHKRSKIFREKVFGWKMKQQPGTTTMDVLLLFKKEPSAELSTDAGVIIPSLLTSDVGAKLRLIEKFEGS
jgi:predicted enzyme related to lactoylglutathione lyase